MGCSSSIEFASPLPARPRGAPPLHLGRLSNIYQLESVLGEGAFAVVRKVRHRTSGQALAVKDILLSRDDSGQRSLNFAEIQVLSLITDHRHIVRLIESFVTPSRAWLVTEYYDGGNAFEYFVNGEEDDPSEPALASVMLGLLRAVEHCQSLGVAHLDIKPENVLLRSHKAPLQAVLTDFGSAQLATETSSLDVIIGTASYMAPEVIRKHYNPFTADMWSIGMTLFTLLSGDPAYEGAYPDLVFARILTTGLQLPYSITKRRSSACQHFLLSLLRRNSVHRLAVLGALDHPWITSGGGATDEMALPDLENPKDDGEC